MQVREYTVGPLLEHTYLIYNEDKKAIIIDPGLNFKKMAYKINMTYDVKAVLLTHAHADHIDGIGYFNCPIYISKLDKDGLSSKKALYEELNQKRSFDIKNLNVKEINSEDVFTIIGITIKPIFTPGHTEGSLCYLIDNNLFSGDTLFKYAYGRTDFYSGNFESMIKSIHRLLDNLADDIYVYPGHDSTTTIGFEKEHNMGYR